MKKDFLFKAAILRKLEEPLSVETISSEELQKGQLCIKMRYAGVCRSQLLEQKGFRGADPWLPHLLGHEGFGTVVEIGSQVSRFKVGDDVIISWIRSPGLEAKKPQYFDSAGNVVNAGPATTFSEFAVVSENRLFPSPKGFPEEVLPLFGCALITGGGMALMHAQPDNVRKICILGFGGIGSAAAIVLKGMGKEYVTIIEKSEARINSAKNMGFKFVRDSFEATDTDFDLVIESSGTIEGIENGFKVLSDDGTLVFASHPPTGQKISLDPHDFLKGKKLFGTWGGDLNLELDINELVKYISMSGINLAKLCGPKFGLNQINEAFLHIDSGEAGRPILKFPKVSDENF